MWIDRARRFVREAFVFFLAAGVALLVAPRAWFPEWFFPRLTGIGALLYALLLSLPSLLYHDEGKGGEAAWKRRSLTRFQVGLAVSSLMAFAGSLGAFRLHRLGFEYDKALHLAVPLIVTVTLAHLIDRWHDVTRRQALAWTILIVGGGMATWELVEFSSDRLLGTAAFGQGGDDIEVDTTLDLALGLAGTAAGALIARRLHGRSPREAV